MSTRTRSYLDDLYQRLKDRDYALEYIRQAFADANLDVQEQALLDVLQAIREEILTELGTL